VNGSAQQNRGGIDTAGIFLARLNVPVRLRNRFVKRPVAAVLHTADAIDLVGMIVRAHGGMNLGGHGG
jgi:hypothetical protein